MNLIASVSLEATFILQLKARSTILLVHPGILEVSSGTFWHQDSIIDQDFEKTLLHVSESYTSNYHPELLIQVTEHILGTSGVSSCNLRGTDNIDRFYLEFRHKEIYALE